MSHPIPRSRRCSEDFKCPSPAEAPDDCLEIFHNIVRLAKLQIDHAVSDWKEPEVIRIGYVFQDRACEVLIRHHKYVDADPMLQSFNQCLAQTGATMRLYLMTQGFNQDVVLATPEEAQLLGLSLQR
jgi:hypothetical protein